MQETWLYREKGSGTRMLTERFCESYCGQQPTKAIEMGSNETIKQAVIAGLGIAIISGHTIIAEMTEGRLATIKAPTLPDMRQWFLVRRKGLTPGVAAQTFRDFILREKDLYVPSWPPVTPARQSGSETKS